MTFAIDIPPVDSGHASESTQHSSVKPAGDASLTTAPARVSAPPSPASLHAGEHPSRPSQDRATHHHSSETRDGTHESKKYKGGSVRKLEKRSRKMEVSLPTKGGNNNNKNNNKNNNNNGGAGGHVSPSTSFASTSKAEHTSMTIKSLSGEDTLCASPTTISETARGFTNFPAPSPSIPSVPSLQTPANVEKKKKDLERSVGAGGGGKKPDDGTRSQRHHKTSLPPPPPSSSHYNPKSKNIDDDTHPKKSTKEERERREATRGKKEEETNQVEKSEGESRRPSRESAKIYEVRIVPVKEMKLSKTYSSFSDASPLSSSSLRQKMEGSSPLSALSPLLSSRAMEKKKGMKATSGDSDEDKEDKDKKTAQKTEFPPPPSLPSSSQPHPQPHRGSGMAVMKWSSDEASRHSSESRKVLPKNSIPVKHDSLIIGKEKKNTFSSAPDTDVDSKENTSSRRRRSGRESEGIERKSSVKPPPPRKRSLSHSKKRPTITAITTTSHNTFSTPTVSTAMIALPPPLPPSLLMVSSTASSSSFHPVESSPSPITSSLPSDHAVLSTTTSSVTRSYPPQNSSVGPPHPLPPLPPSSMSSPRGGFHHSSPHVPPPPAVAPAPSTSPSSSSSPMVLSPRHRTLSQGNDNPPHHGNSLPPTTSTPFSHTNAHTNEDNRKEHPQNAHRPRKNSGSVDNSGGTRRTRRGSRKEEGSLSISRTTEEDKVRQPSKKPKQQQQDKILEAAPLHSKQREGEVGEGKNHHHHHHHQKKKNGQKTLPHPTSAPRPPSPFSSPLRPPSMANSRDPRPPTKGKRLMATKPTASPGWGSTSYPPSPTITTIPTTSSTNTHRDNHTHHSPIHKISRNSSSSSRGRRRGSSESKEGRESSVVLRKGKQKSSDLPEGMKVLESESKEREIEMENTHMRKKKNKTVKEEVNVDSMEKERKKKREKENMQKEHETKQEHPRREKEQDEQACTVLSHVRDSKEKKQHRDGGVGDKKRRKRSSVSVFSSSLPSSFSSPGRLASDSLSNPPPQPWTPSIGSSEENSTSSRDANTSITMNKHPNNHKKKKGEEREAKARKNSQPSDENLHPPPPPTTTGGSAGRHYDGGPRPENTSKDVYFLDSSHSVKALKGKGEDARRGKAKKERGDEVVARGGCGGSESSPVTSSLTSPTKFRPTSLLDFSSSIGRYRFPAREEGGGGEGNERSDSHPPPYGNKGHEGETPTTTCTPLSPFRRSGGDPTGGEKGGERTTHSIPSSPVFSPYLSNKNTKVLYENILKTTHPDLEKRTERMKMMLRTGSTNKITAAAAAAADAIRHRSSSLLFSDDSAESYFLSNRFGGRAKASMGVTRMNSGTQKQKKRNHLARNKTKKEEQEEREDGGEVGMTMRIMEGGDPVIISAPPRRRRRLRPREHGNREEEDHQEKSQNLMSSSKGRNVVPTSFSAVKEEGGGTKKNKNNKMKKKSVRFASISSPTSSSLQRKIQRPTVAVLPTAAAVAAAGTTRAAIAAAVAPPSLKFFPASRPSSIRKASLRAGAAPSTASSSSSFKRLGAAMSSARLMNKSSSILRGRMSMRSRPPLPPPPLSTYFQKTNALHSKIPAPTRGPPESNKGRGRKMIPYGHLAPPPPPSTRTTTARRKKSGDDGRGAGVGPAGAPTIHRKGGGNDTDELLLRHPHLHHRGGSGSGALLSPFSHPMTGTEYVLVEVPSASSFFSGAPPTRLTTSTSDFVVGVPLQSQKKEEEEGDVRKGDEGNVHPVTTTTTTIPPNSHLPTSEVDSSLSPLSSSTPGPTTAAAGGVPFTSTSTAGGVAHYPISQHQRLTGSPLFHTSSSGSLLHPRLPPSSVSSSFSTHSLYTSASSSRSPSVAHPHHQHPPLVRETLPDGVFPTHRQAEQDQHASGVSSSLLKERGVRKNGKREEQEMMDVNEADADDHRQGGSGGDDGGGNNNRSISFSSPSDAMGMVKRNNSSHRRLFTRENSSSSSSPSSSAADTTNHHYRPSSSSSNRTSTRTGCSRSTYYNTESSRSTSLPPPSSTTSSYSFIATSDEVSIPKKWRKKDGRSVDENGSDPYAYLALMKKMEAKRKGLPYNKSPSDTRSTNSAGPSRSRSRSRSWRSGGGYSGSSSSNSRNSSRRRRGDGGRGDKRSLSASPSHSLSQTTGSAGPLTTSHSISSNAYEQRKSVLPASLVSSSSSVPSPSSMSGASLLLRRAAEEEERRQKQPPQQGKHAKKDRREEGGSWSVIVKSGKNQREDPISQSFTSDSIPVTPTNILPSGGGGSSSASSLASSVPSLRIFRLVPSRSFPDRSSSERSGGSAPTSPTSTGLLPPATKKTNLRAAGASFSTSSTPASPHPPPGITSKSSSLSFSRSSSKEGKKVTNKEKKYVDANDPYPSPSRSGSASFAQEGGSGGGGISSSFTSPQKHPLPLSHTNSSNSRRKDSVAAASSSSLSRFASRRPLRNPNTARKDTPSHKQGKEEEGKAKIGKRNSKVKRPSTRNETGERRKVKKEGNKKSKKRKSQDIERRKNATTKGIAEKGTQSSFTTISTTSPHLRHTSFTQKSFSPRGKRSGRKVSLRSPSPPGDGGGAPPLTSYSFPVSLSSSSSSFVHLSHSNPASKVPSAVSSPLSSFSSPRTPQEVPFSAGDSGVNTGSTSHHKSSSRSSRESSTSCIPPQHSSSGNNTDNMTHPHRHSHRASGVPTTWADAAVLPTELTTSPASPSSPASPPTKHGEQLRWCTPTSTTTTTSSSHSGSSSTQPAEDSRIPRRKRKESDDGEGRKMKEKEGTHRRHHHHKEGSSTRLQRDEAVGSGASPISSVSVRRLSHDAKSPTGAKTGVNKSGSEMFLDTRELRIGEGEGRMAPQGSSGRPRRKRTSITTIITPTKGNADAGNEIAVHYPLGREQAIHSSMTPTGGSVTSSAAFSSRSPSKLGLDGFHHSNPPSVHALASSSSVLLHESHHTMPNNNNKKKKKKHHHESLLSSSLVSSSAVAVAVTPPPPPFLPSPLSPTYIHFPEPPSPVFPEPPHSPTPVDAQTSSRDVTPVALPPPPFSTSCSSFRTSLSSGPCPSSLGSGSTPTSGRQPSQPEHHHQRTKKKNEREKMFYDPLHPQARAAPGVVVTTRAGEGGPATLTLPSSGGEATSRTAAVAAANAFMNSPNTYYDHKAHYPLPEWGAFPMVKKVKQDLDPAPKEKEGEVEGKKRLPSSALVDAKRPRKNTSHRTSAGDGVSDSRIDRDEIREEKQKISENGREGRASTSVISFTSSPSSPRYGHGENISFPLERGKENSALSVKEEPIEARREGGGGGKVMAENKMHKRSKKREEEERGQAKEEKLLQSSLLPSYQQQQKEGSKKKKKTKEEKREKGRKAKEEKQQQEGRRGDGSGASASSLSFSRERWKQRSEPPSPEKQRRRNDMSEEDEKKRKKRSGTKIKKKRKKSRRRTEELGSSISSCSGTNTSLALSGIASFSFLPPSSSSFPLANHDAAIRTSVSSFGVSSERRKSSGFASDRQPLPPPPSSFSTPSFPLSLPQRPSTFGSLVQHSGGRTPTEVKKDKGKKKKKKKNNEKRKTSEVEGIPPPFTEKEKQRTFKSKKEKKEIKEDNTLLRSMRDHPTTSSAGDDNNKISSDWHPLILENPLNNSSRCSSRRSSKGKKKMKKRAKKEKKKKEGDYSGGGGSEKKKSNPWDDHIPPSPHRSRSGGSRRCTNKDEEEGTDRKTINIRMVENDSLYNTITSSSAYASSSSSITMDMMEEKRPAAGPRVATAGTTSSTVISNMATIIKTTATTTIQTMKRGMEAHMMTVQHPGEELVFLTGLELPIPTALPSSAPFPLLGGADDLPSLQGHVNGEKDVSSSPFSPPALSSSFPLQHHYKYHLQHSPSLSHYMPPSSPLYFPASENGMTTESERRQSNSHRGEGGGGGGGGGGGVAAAAPSPLVEPRTPFSMNRKGSTSPKRHHHHKNEENHRQEVERERCVASVETSWEGREGSRESSRPASFHSTEPKKISNSHHNSPKKRKKARRAMTAVKKKEGKKMNKETKKKKKKKDSTTSTCSSSSLLKGESTRRQKKRKQRKKTSLERRGRIKTSASPSSSVSLSDSASISKLERWSKSLSSCPPSPSYLPSIGSRRGGREPCPPLRLPRSHSQSSASLLSSDPRRRTSPSPSSSCAIFSSDTKPREGSTHRYESALRFPLTRDEEDCTQLGKSLRRSGGRPTPRGRSLPKQQQKHEPPLHSGEGRDSARKGRTTTTPMPTRRRKAHRKGNKTGMRCRWGTRSPPPPPAPHSFTPSPLSLSASSSSSSCSTYASTNRKTSSPSSLSRRCSRSFPLPSSSRGRSRGPEDQNHKNNKKNRSSSRELSVRSTVDNKIPSGIYPPSSSHHLRDPSFSLSTTTTHSKNTNTKSPSPSCHPRKKGRGKKSLGKNSNTTTTTTTTTATAGEEYSSSSSSRLSTSTTSPKWNSTSLEEMRSRTPRSPNRDNSSPFPSSCSSLSQGSLSLASSCQASSRKVVNCNKCRREENKKKKSANKEKGKREKESKKNSKKRIQGLKGGQVALREPVSDVEEADDKISSRGGKGRERDEQGGGRRRSPSPSPSSSSSSSLSSSSLSSSSCSSRSSSRSTSSSVGAVVWEVVRPPLLVQPSNHEEVRPHALWKNAEVLEVEMEVHEDSPLPLPLAPFAGIRVGKREKNEKTNKRHPRRRDEDDDKKKMEVESIFEAERRKIEQEVADWQREEQAALDLVWRELEEKHRLLEVEKRRQEVELVRVKRRFQRDGAEAERRKMEEEILKAKRENREALMVLQKELEEKQKELETEKQKQAMYFSKLRRERCRKEVEKEAVSPSLEEGTGECLLPEVRILEVSQRQLGEDFWWNGQEDEEENKQKKSCDVPRIEKEELEVQKRAEDELRQIEVNLAKWESEEEEAAEELCRRKIQRQQQQQQKKKRRNPSNSKNSSDASPLPSIPLASLPPTLEDKNTKSFQIPGVEQSRNHWQKDNSTSSSSTSAPSALNPPRRRRKGKKKERGTSTLSPRRQRKYFGGAERRQEREDNTKNKSIILLQTDQHDDDNKGRIKKKEEEKQAGRGSKVRRCDEPFQTRTSSRSNKKKSNSRNEKESAAEKEHQHQHQLPTSTVKKTCNHPPVLLTEVYDAERMKKRQERWVKQEEHRRQEMESLWEKEWKSLRTREKLSQAHLEMRLARRRVEQRAIERQRSVEEAKRRKQDAEAGRGKGKESSEEIRRRRLREWILDVHLHTVAGLTSCRCSRRSSSRRSGENQTLGIPDMEKFDGTSRRRKRLHKENVGTEMEGNGDREGDCPHGRDISSFVGHETHSFPPNGGNGCTSRQTMRGTAIATTITSRTTTGTSTPQVHHQQQGECRGVQRQQEQEGVQADKISSARFLMEAELYGNPSRIPSHALQEERRKALLRIKKRRREREMEGAYCSFQNAVCRVYEGKRNSEIIPSSTLAPPLPRTIESKGRGRGGKRVRKGGGNNRRLGGGEVTTSGEEEGPPSITSSSRRKNSAATPFHLPSISTKGKGDVKTGGGGEEKSISLPSGAKGKGSVKEGRRRNTTNKAKQGCTSPTPFSSGAPSCSSSSLSSSRMPLRSKWDHKKEIKLREAKQHDKEWKRGTRHEDGGNRIVNRLFSSASSGSTFSSALAGSVGGSGGGSFLSHSLPAFSPPFSSSLSGGSERAVVFLPSPSSSPLESQEPHPPPRAPVEPRDSPQHRKPHHHSRHSNASSSSSSPSSMTIGTNHHDLHHHRRNLTTSTPLDFVLPSPGTLSSLEPSPPAAGEKADTGSQRHPNHRASSNSSSRTFHHHSSCSSSRQREETKTPEKKQIIYVQQPAIVPLRNGMKKRDNNAPPPPPPPSPSPSPPPLLSALCPSSSSCGSSAAARVKRLRREINEKHKKEGEMLSKLVERGLELVEKVEGALNDSLSSSLLPSTLSSSSITASSPSFSSPFPTSSSSFAPGGIRRLKNKTSVLA